ncbi:haloacid dehalogenase type II [Sneathiella litorea]|uniref:(S)-2-haloacid dehalogenase n=1 Tax=Sneathiella litorea TaxID=2606216 RepID=A0A6L8WAK6_9PROT|nr:haloacid dehalogenase type II [Sneathiella litorea]MZR31684.1 haloacid dehalogenase type II [Sneathiella litorea]
MSAANVKVLCFDVFGTVTDWYSSVTQEGQKISEKTGISVPWGEFVKKWRIEGYQKVLGEISSGKMDIIPTETIHRNMLEILLDEYSVTGLSNSEIDNFNRVWNRLGVWDDVAEGLKKLKENYSILPFSNGDFRCLLDLSRHNQLPWDGIISADFFKKVKPDPTIYHDAANLLQLPPEEIMMVACHARDLQGAKNAGFKTAYVNRPLEYGPGARPEEKTVPFDYEVDDFIELAEVLRTST